MPEMPKDLLKLLGYRYLRRDGHHYRYVNSYRQIMRLHSQRDEKTQILKIWKQYRQHRYDQKCKRVKAM